MLRFVRAAIAASVIFVPAAVFAAGAIAIDDEEGQHHEDVGYGVATGADTREEAAADALRRCRSEGNKDCRVVVRFDACGAYAVSDRHYGTGWGNTLRAAQNRALEQCGSNCRVVVSECE